MVLKARFWVTETWHSGEELAGLAGPESASGKL